MAQHTNSAELHLHWTLLSIFSKYHCCHSGEGFAERTMKKQLLGFDLLSCSQYCCMICSFEHLQEVKTQCSVWPPSFCKKEMDSWKILMSNIRFNHDVCGKKQAAYRSENNHHHYLVQESYLFRYYNYQALQLLERLCRICGHRQPAA